MKYEIKWGEYLDIRIPWVYLHIIYGVMAFLANFIPSNDEYHKYLKQVELALRKKVATQIELKHIHTCKVCNGFIDDRKDRFYHQEFESGYEEWRHLPECPVYKEFK